MRNPDQTGKGRESFDLPLQSQTTQYNPERLKNKNQ
jgi:hypothetical protein